MIDEVLKASDIKFENGRIYMQAGKEIIAETPVISEEVSAEIVGENTPLNLDENESVKRGLSKETAQKQVDKLQRGKEYRINNAARVTFTGNYNEEGMPIFINAKGNEQAYSLTNVFDEILDENGQGKLFQSAMMSGINPKQKVNIVDLSSQKQNIPDKNALLNYIKSLIGKNGITTSDKKAILNFVKNSYRIDKNGKGKNI